MKTYFYFIYALSFLLILCFYIYGLSLNINNLELKSKIQVEIQQLVDLKNKLIFKNDELVEQVTQKILHNEDIKTVLIELIKTSSENVYPKFAIIFTVIVLVGVIFYLNCLEAPASTSTVVSTASTAYNSLVQSQVETTRVILNLQSLVDNNQLQICRLTEELKNNIDVISTLNLKIEDLTSSFNRLEELHTLAGNLLSVSSGSGGWC